MTHVSSSLLISPSEMNITGTLPPLLFGKIMKPNFAIFDSFRSAFVYTPSMASHVFSGSGLVMISFKFPASGNVPVIFISLISPVLQGFFSGYSGFFPSLKSTLLGPQGFH